MARTRPTSELRALTPAGEAMVAAATRFAGELAPGALDHDRTGTFATEHLDKLRADGFLVAVVPEALGGGGVTSVHDLLVASSRLAQGDAATTIGVNMHFAVLGNLVRHLDVARARGEEDRAAGLAASLELVVQADVVFATAVSEPSPQDLTRPRTVAVRTDDGWVVTGRKAFATMAPAATLVNVAVTYEDDDCHERYGFAIVPVGAPGVRFHDDWDALGMRASASGSVSFERVRIGPDDVRDGFPVGVHSVPLLDRFLTSGALHAAASLGIAEAAQAQIVERLARRGPAAAEDPHVVVRLAESVVDLTSMRATLGQAGRLIDEYHAAFPAGDPELADAQAVYAEVQAAKAHLNQAAARVVDRALALSGGAGYLAADPLAKAYRDVRAGAFMHPIGANRVDALLTRTALGLALA